MKKKKPSLAETVSRNIRKARLEAGMTQKELADKAGFKVSYVARLETKPQNITLNVLEQICTSLDIHSQMILTFSECSPLKSNSLKTFRKVFALLKTIEAEFE